LSPDEAEFLRRSCEAQQQREANELEAAKRLARAEAERAEEAIKREQDEKNSAQKLRRRAWIAAGLGVIAVIFGVIAWIMMLKSESYRVLAEQRAGNAEKTVQEQSETIYNLRTSAILRELQPRAASLAKELIDKAKEKAIDARLVSGMRSLAEQEELYARGRTKPGPIITNAKISVHNTGLAFDVGVFKNGEYVPEGPEYAILGQIGKQIGLVWGGDSAQGFLPSQGLAVALWKAVFGI
jgi:hypothetical protein